MDNIHQNVYGKNKKRLRGVIWSALLVLSFVCLSQLWDSVAFAKTNTAGAYIVIERTSGRVLFSSNENLKMYPASTTKILTTLTVLDKVKDIEQIVAIDDKAVGVEGSSIYLKKGDKRSVKELLYGLMLRSGNDAAVALALYVSPDIEQFAKLMNDKAKECGAENSNFVNPNGLHDDNHYTTASDLAKISAAAMKNETFRKIVSTKTIVFGEGENKRYYTNKNKMLATFEGATGIKTGYTKNSGRCLVSSAMRDDMELICVVLNRYDMWNDSKNLLNRGFNEFELKPLLEGYEKEVNVLKGKSVSCKAVPENTGLYPVKKDGSDKFEIKAKVKTLKAPFKAGTECGTVEVYDGNRLIYRQKLVTINSVEKKSFFDRF
ncbi:serine-type D-Ala-D-Ala carboxypeptidase [Acidaminococcus sp. CAG:917]|nr:serine-type D-Ala-D-Ala carboxypeptidase [Acidaminococcus sp. CAG:917]